MGKNLFERIREIVKQIPEGKVATYGQIAKIIGTKDARKVGWAMHGNKDPLVPCHRVVKADGSVAKNFAFGGAEEQRARLEAEGVGFKSETKVDLDQYLWNN